jgi:hypothetical protein
MDAYVGTALLYAYSGRISASSGVMHWRANAWFVAGPMWRLGLHGSGNGGEENGDAVRLPERRVRRTVAPTARLPFRVTSTEWRRRRPTQTAMDFSEVLHLR